MKIVTYLYWFSLIHDASLHPYWMINIVLCVRLLAHYTTRHRPTWLPPVSACANIIVSCPCPPMELMVTVVFFFLPRLDGVGITTTWGAPSPSFLSTRKTKVTDHCLDQSWRGQLLRLCACHMTMFRSECFTWRMERWHDHGCRWMPRDKGLRGGGRDESSLRSRDD